MTLFLDKFKEVVKLYPDCVAISQNGDTSITYRELYDKASQVGYLLKSKGVKSESVVGLQFEKSIDYIVALLGTWFAGGAFVPLDPHLPKDRLDFILKDAEIDVVLTQVDLQNLKERMDPELITPDTLAYVIYTSGSTGQPKGVMVEHKGLVNILQAQIDMFELKAGDKSLFYLSHSFDASLSDIGTALLSGATLCIESPCKLQSISAVTKTVNNNQINYMDIPPSLLKMLNPEDMPASLKCIVIGGEACSIETVKTWSSKVKLVNVYGPTEATICTSMCVCNENWNKPLIGNPIPNVNYTIINDELYISGIQLARGYKNKADLTDKKFPIIDGVQYYKTGDKVLEHEDSSIEFLGRVDRQVKIRGQLVELEEIENQLKTETSIRQVAVVKRPIVDGSLRAQLVAFVEADKVDVFALKNRLQQSLPCWMIPQRFEVIQTLPKTVTGKVDIQKLTSISLVESAKKSNLQTATEKTLATLWKNILEVDNLNQDDNFFELGGDSLSAFELTLDAEMNGLKLSPALIAKNPILKDMAKAIDLENVNEFSDAKSAASLKVDVAFDDEWKKLFDQAAKREKVDNSQPENVFLTGATGFLGSRLLLKILENSNANVYALVRAENNKNALDRVLHMLNKQGLKVAEKDIKRICPVVGDITQKNLGMPNDKWGFLSENIDTIYHCAAVVNTVLTYENLYNANVGGTKEVLKLALLGRRKHLHYASTLSVFVSTDKNSGQLLESDNLENTNFVYGGYGQTKWAAEYLLRQVPQKSCDISFYRLGLITGDSKTGFSSDSDFLNMFVKGLYSLKSAPIIKQDIYVDITPIDYAASALYEISKNGSANTYHIANKQGLSFNAFVAEIENNTQKDIEKLPYNAWQNEIQALDYMTIEESATYLALCRASKEPDFNRHRTMDLFQATDVVFDTKNTDEILKTSGIKCPEVSSNLLSTYIEFIMKGKSDV